MSDRPHVTTGALVVVTARALPGERVAEPALVDEAVARVNAIVRVRALDAAREIGEYLIDRFFRGDVAALRERGRKHASFRRLAARDDLEVSASFLWHACAVAAQARDLPDSLADALPLSHHRLLLPVRDVELKVALARRAVHEGLSKRAFEEEVRRVRAELEPPSRAGRPPLPRVVKALGRIGRAVREVVDVPVDEVEDSPEQARALRDELSTHIDALTALRDRLDAVARGGGR